MGLAAAKGLKIRNAANKKWGRCQIMTGATVFQNQMLSFQYDTAAHVMPMTAVSGTSLQCVGIAKENYNTSLAAALVTAEYFWNCEVYLALTTVSVGMLNGVVHAAGDSTDKCCGLTTLGSPIGMLRELNGTSYGWVEIGVFTRDST